MGADIHIFVEYKEPGDNYWQRGIKDMHAPRAYDLFARLADVRNDGTIEPLPLVGLEKDSPTWYNINDGELHSPNTISLEDWITETGDYGPVYGAVTAFCLRLSRAAYQVRIIVAFDS